MYYIRVILLNNNSTTDLDVKRAGEDFIFELVAVGRGARPNDLIGFHPPELEPVMFVVAGTLEHGRLAWRHFDDGVLER